MRIYIAGPYTQGDVAANVNAAITAAEILAQRGHSPYVPHLTHFWHLIYPHRKEDWLNLDRVWLSQCEAVLRLPGESEGADIEVELAKRLGLPVYTHIDFIPQFVGRADLVCDCKAVLATNVTPRDAIHISEAHIQHKQTWFVTG